VVEFEPHWNCKAMNLSDKRIAYSSIKIAIDPAMPTYSGSLGILACDTLRAAAEQAPK
jgi:glycogen phosphorylase